MNEEPTRIAVAVVEHKSESGSAFLVGLRPDGVPLAGYHEFPGGKVRAGETFESAVVRECLEETGLKIRIVGTYDAVEFDYQHDRVHLRFFRCITDGHERVEPVGSFRWIDRAELASCRFPEANAGLLKEILSADGAKPGETLQ